MEDFVLNQNNRDGAQVKVVFNNKLAFHDAEIIYSIIPYLIDN